MTRRNELLDHAVELFPAPNEALQRVKRRHQRRIRTRRLTAAAVGLVIAVVLSASVVSVVRSRESVPADRLAPPLVSGDIAFTVGDKTQEQVYLVHPDGTVTQFTRGPASHRALAWSPDGSRLVVLDQDSGLVSLTVEGTDPVTLFDHLHSRWGAPLVSFSPDGTKVAFQDGPRLFVADADGSHRIALADQADWRSIWGSSGFCWSPDSTRIAFSQGERPEDYRIYIANVDGTGASALPIGSLWDVQHPAWSPDGARIAFSATRPGHMDHDVFVMNLDGSGRTRIEPHKGTTRPEWSPDGSHLAVDGGGIEWITSIDQVQWIWLPGCGACGISWSPDGSRVGMIGGHGTRSSRDIYVSDVDGSDRVRIARLPAGAAGSYVLQPLWWPGS